MLGIIRVLQVVVLASPRFMVYAFLFVSSLATGALLAMTVRILFDVEHVGALLAVCVIGAGLQVAAVIAWYLFHTRPRAADQRPELLARGEAND